MTSETVRATLNHIWKSLKNYECALMGGVALASWFHPRATRDIDFLIRVARRNVDELLSELQPDGYRPKKQPPLLVVGEFAFVQLLYVPPGEFFDVQIDLMLAENDLQISSLQRRVSRIVPGIDNAIDVLSCEDLLLFKLIAGRMIDRADCTMLLRENHQTLDREYLSTWTSRLKLELDFQAVWDEALPG